MFAFALGFAAMVVGLVFRLGFAFGLMALKVSLALGKSFFKLLSLVGQSIGRLAAKGFKALAVARKRRQGDEAKDNGCIKAA